MPLSRRLGLLQWAQDNNALIVEDDYDSEFRYSGRPIPALQGFDAANRVLYVGTFSKIMFPGLQLGYLVLPPELVSVFTRAKWLCDHQCSLINQAALADFIQLGHLARHIRKMRTVYAQRRETLIQTLQAATNALGTTNFFGDAAGLHLMAQLPLAQADLSSRALVARAQAQGIGLFNLQRYYLAPPTVDEGKFIFGFGGLSEKVIEETTAQLKLLLQK
ncbi:MAG: PLP-dependent aminotransferase family protein [Cyanobacteria bacterium J06573_11]